MFAGDNGSEIPGGQNQFELYKRGFGMASSIKSQPDPDDQEDSVLTKAEKVCRFGSVGNNKICPRSENPKHGINPCQEEYATRYIPWERPVLE